MYIMLKTELDTKIYNDRPNDKRQKNICNVIDRELIVAHSVIPGRRVRRCRLLMPGAPVNHGHQGTRVEARAARPGNYVRWSLGSKEETPPHVRDTLPTICMIIPSLC